MRRVTGDRPSHLILRYKNRRSWRIDVFWFLELEEELGLFCRNRFYDSFAVHNSGGVLLDPTFPSSWVSSLRSCWFCFAKFEIFPCGWRPARLDTISIHNRTRTARLRPLQSTYGRHGEFLFSDV